MSERNGKNEFPMGPVIAQASMAFGVLFSGLAVYAGIIQLESGMLGGGAGDLHECGERHADTGWRAAVDRSWPHLAGCQSASHGVRELSSASC